MSTVSITINLQRTVSYDKRKNIKNNTFYGSFYAVIEGVFFVVVCYVTQNSQPILITKNINGATNRTLSKRSITPP